jgi:hypothetical protein
MTTTTKNPAAVALGKLSAGHPKRLTPEERQRRADAMRQHAAGLWEKRRARGTDKWKAKAPYKRKASENVCEKCGKKISVSDMYFVSGKMYHKIAACTGVSEQRLNAAEASEKH